MNKNVYKFTPLEKEGNTYFVKHISDFTYPWADEEFVKTFEKQLQKNFEEVKGNVIIDGAEFRNCSLFKPKETIDDNYYIKVSVNNIPIDLDVDPEIEDTKISVEELEKSKLTLIRSESYYRNDYMSLDNNYLYPCLKTSDEEIISYLDEQIFLIHPRLLIIGSAGSGKTTLVRKLAYELSSRIEGEDSGNNIIPVYFKLRDFSKTQKQLSDIVTSQYSLISKKNLSYQKLKGRVLLIFDGIDELNKEDKLGFFNWMNDYLKSEKTIRLMVTSRSSEDLSHPVFKAFEKLFLQPLYASQIYELCKRILGSDTEANNFYSLIKNNSNLVEILSNPLSLSLSLGIYKYKKILPTNVATFINEIITLFTDNWDEKRSIHRYTLLTSKNSRHILSRLAYELKVDDKFTFDALYCQKFFPSEFNLKKIEEVLTEIKDITNLIVYENESWSFSHTYFQDFFCASYLIDRSESIEGDFLKFKNKSNWLNVWNSAIELSNDPEFYFNLQKTNKTSAFYNLSRIVTVLLTIDDIPIMKDINFTDYFLKTSKEFEKSIESVHIKAPLSIKFNQKIDVEKSELGYLLTQIYLLQRVKRLGIKRLIKNTELKFFKFLNELLKFDDVPKFTVDNEDIIFSHDKKTL